MEELTQGANCVIKNKTIDVAVQCTLTSGSSNELDVSAFMLNASDKVLQDESFIFYNQPTSPDGAVTLNCQQPEHQIFSINLLKVATDVQKIAIVITAPQAFSQAKLLRIDVGGELFYQPVKASLEEKSLILAEIYRHNDNWKFRAVGQGYKGGLAPLATRFGVDISDEPEQAIVPPPVNIQKTSISLEKSGEKATISLKKGQKLTARLKWDTKADLDLYCFYVDNSGKEDKVYYRRMGDLNKPPFIKLLGDSMDAGEEVIEISKPENIKYALIAAYSAVSNGTGSFFSYRARIVVTNNDTQEVTSHLAHDDPRSYWVSFALIDFTNPEKIEIKNVESYSNKEHFKEAFMARTGHKPASLFGGSKSNVNGISSYNPECSPHLFQDGSFMMSVGEIEFK
ncbi:TerD family protein [Neptunomonas antarctica]|uniref:Stress response protein SCP2 n=1 Tax=Neptunomonas antarctica TaxID=619304 RepID=A0A1N7MXA8_9GAMM|nr:TerD family protein [Neptunomonas antarctica]SIS90519.1 Stress response protein SCP2 [Neptunomonas antarctica]